MPELRYNPLLKDWTMVAEGRQERPVLGRDECPFCPGSAKVPQDYDVMAYPNDYPPLSLDPPPPAAVATGLYRVQPAYGRCEVILYSSDHQASLATLPLRHLRRLVDLWTDRYRTLGQDPRIQYVLIFENRGSEVGVTLTHPHGQIYAYPYIPQKIRVELDASREHREETGRCLVCDMNREELTFAGRVVFENEAFACYIPFFTDYPFGVMIVPKAHRAALTDLTDEERSALAAALGATVGGMDALYPREFPYMMVVHQRPTGSAALSADVHLHIEFYPPLRAPDRIKYLASSETGAWAPCNPLAVEDTAPMLRAAIQRALRGMEG